MSEQENIKASMAFFEAWNAGDLSKNSAYIADNYIGEGPGRTAPMTSDQESQFNQNFLNAFPGSKFEILLTIVQGEYVVNHWKASGKNTGTLISPSGVAVPPSGKMVTLMGSTTSQVKNGKVVHSWAFWDMASLLTQIGLLPPM